MTEKAATAWLGLGFLCLYLLIAGGHYGGDGFWSYLTAESLLLDGDLTLGDRPFLVREMVHQYTPQAGGGITAALGKRYSMYGLGLALLEVPFYAAGHLLASLFPGVPKDYLTMFAVSTTNTFVSAAWCALCFAFARTLGYTRRACLWIAALFGLGSFAFPYASYGFSEPLLGLCFLGAAYALYLYRLHGNSSSLVWAGALTGLAVLTKIYAVITLPLFAAYLWFALKSRPSQAWSGALISILVPLILFACLTAWYNYARFGGILKTGYHLVDFDRLGGFFTFTPFQILTGLYGLLLSSGRGLFLFLPVSVLSVAALRRFAGAFRPEALLFAALVAEHLLFYAAYGNWHGGSSWGPRFLLPVVPFLILPLGSLLEGPGARPRAVRTLGALGFFVQLPAALVNYHLFVRFVQEKNLGLLGRPGDPLFSPSLSPILGGYYQLASALSRLLTGGAIAYPVPSVTQGKTVSLAACDLIDLWWANAIGTGFLGGLATAGVLLAVAALLAGLTVSATRVIRWSQQN